MVVNFSPEEEAQLSLIAAHVGMDSERLVKDAALRLLEQRKDLRDAGRQGLEQADRGEFVEDDEVRLWLEHQERR
jgi:predicted transcriptional regulator